MGYSPQKVREFASHRFIPDSLLKGWTKEAKYDPVALGATLVNDVEQSGIVTFLSSGLFGIFALLVGLRYYDHHTDVIVIAVTVVLLLATVASAVLYIKALYKRSRYETASGEFGHDLYQITQALNQHLGDLLIHQPELVKDARTVLERLGSAFREAREGAEADRTNAELERDAAAKKVKLSDAYDLCLRFGLIEKPRLAWKPYLKKSAQPAPANESQAA